MTDRKQWPQGPAEVTAPRTLDLEEPVTALKVRVFGGTVNVVGSPETDRARVEIAEVHGPPLTVSYEDGTLTVGYDDLPWKNFLKFLERKEWQRSAVASVTVPTTVEVELGTVTASAVVSGIGGRTELRGVSGESTLVGLSGPVHAGTVSGRVQAQAVRGDLRFDTVSGDLTVIEGCGGSVQAESVNGDMVLDLDPAANGTDVQLRTVSGEIAIRLPDPADAEVDANTTSGTVANAFEDLRVDGRWGAKRVTGRLGAGTGRLKASTVSGSLALLRRPPAEDAPRDGAPGDPQGDAPAEPPADRKVL